MQIVENKYIFHNSVNDCRILKLVVCSQMGVFHRCRYKIISKILFIHPVKIQ